MLITIFILYGVNGDGTTCIGVRKNDDNGNLIEWRLEIAGALILNIMKADNRQKFAPRNELDDAAIVAKMPGGTERDNTRYYHGDKRLLSPRHIWKLWFKPGGHFAWIKRNADGEVTSVH